MGFYEMGCACSDKPNAVSGAESNLVKSEKLAKQAQQLRAQANQETAKGNWTRASDMNDKAAALEKQAANLPTLTKTKARIASRHSKITGAGVAAAVGIAATLGLVGYAASKKRA